MDASRIPQPPDQTEDMSAAADRKLEAARKLAIYEWPGYFEIQRAQAAMWLLEQIDNDHLPFCDLETMDADDLEGWVRSIVRDAVTVNQVAVEKKMIEAATAGLTPAARPTLTVAPCRRPQDEPA
jgi:hypothetical protein